VSARIVWQREDRPGRSVHAFLALDVPASAATARAHRITACSRGYAPEELVEDASGRRCRRCIKALDRGTFAPSARPRSAPGAALDLELRWLEDHLAAGRRDKAIALLERLTGTREREAFEEAREECLRAAQDYAPDASADYFGRAVGACASGALVEAAGRIERLGRARREAYSADRPPLRLVSGGRR
jgi:hypothetical protein